MPAHPHRTERARLVLIELARAWKHFNWLYLDSRLLEPGFEISDAAATLGSWHGARRLIRMSAHHLWRDPWLGVMETLRHEMAHQYVEEYLRVRDEAPHGPAFRKACHLLRVSPATTGTGGEVTPSVARIEPRLVTIRDKIQKLLSLATSPNEHEAQSAMLKARQLLFKHNVSEQDLERAENHYALRRLGAVKARWHRHEYCTAAILRKFFFVETLWSPAYNIHQAKRGSELHVYGTPTNLDMAEYVHGFLEALLPRLWLDFRRRSSTRSNRGRLHYYWGVTEGFYEKLAGQETALRESDALVWLGDPGLRQFFRYLNPRTESRSAVSITVHDTFNHGRSEGRHVTLHKPVKSAPQIRGNRLAT